MFVLCSSATVSLSNMSLLYLNFATQVIFKSSKVIPVMVVGALVWRKSFSCMHYFSAVVLIAGLVLVCATSSLVASCSRSLHVFDGDVVM
jgi:adenosine 3'-phospho 5'-phosphosulfate transporter B3